MLELESTPAALLYAGMTSAAAHILVSMMQYVSMFLEGLLGLREGDAEHLLDVKLSSSPSDSSLMRLLVGFLCGAVQRQSCCFSRDCWALLFQIWGCCTTWISAQDRLGKETAEHLLYIQSRLLADIAHAVRGEKSSAEAQLVSLEHLTT